jgi:TRAP-type mannitol/chloroaromatic compound transport system substrate-binding protein
LVSANVAWCFDYGFHEASKYVYPSSNINICHLEFAVNMDAWKKLPEDLKSIITVCAKEAELEMLSQNHNWDAGRLKEAKDKWGITTQSLDQDSRNKLSKVMLEAVGQYEKSDPSFAKLATILKDYMKEMGTQ